MKRATRNKSMTSSALITSTVPSSTDLDLFSSYSHEQVHIFDKLCSSISSMCEVAYCTSEGITICVPQTCQRQSSTNSSTSCSLCPMLITRIPYPFQSSDQNNSIEHDSTSNKFLEKLKEKYLANLYRAYKLRPTSLSSFDRLIGSDLIQFKGFRSCLFSPLDASLNQGQSILAAVSCANELFIYEILSSSRRFFVSQSSKLQIDLTKYLMERCPIEKYLEDSQSEDHYRFLYFHLTSQILWNKTGTILFQLQYSGHLIVWKFNRKNLFHEPSFSIIDTKVCKPLAMVSSDENQLIIIFGKENQRSLVHWSTEEVVVISSDQNDYMNTEHAELILNDQNTLILVESKMNYCFISTIDIKEKQTSTYRCQLSDYYLFSSPIVGLQHHPMNSCDQAVIHVGCDDGMVYSLFISDRFPLKILEVKLIANGQIKTCSRKPLLLRDFNLSFNQLLLARIFYSPIVSPNVKFGFVICTFHRLSTDSTTNSNQMIEKFLLRTDVPLWCSSDEIAILFHDIQRGIIKDYQTNRNFDGNYQALQRLCRLYHLMGKNSLIKKQIEIVENQFLELYRCQLSTLFKSLFTGKNNKLTGYETLIRSICLQTDTNSISSSLFLCPLCNRELSMTKSNLLFASCSNKHLWPRCPRTLLPLALESAQTCSLCDRNILEVDMNDKNYVNLIKHRDGELNIFFSTFCTYCL